MEGSGNPPEKLLIHIWQNIKEGPEEDQDQADDLYDRATALYDKYCADKFGTTIPSDLKNYLDGLPDQSKVSPRDLMDLLEDLKNTARNNADNTNVPEDGGVTKKRWITINSNDTWQQSGITNIYLFFIWYYNILE